MPDDNATKPSSLNLSAGMVKAVGRGGLRTTCTCGMPIPKYPGRYPKNCPLCGVALDRDGVSAPPAEPEE